MASVMAVVRLAPGRVGYFDDITRIHLTIAAPEKPVITGMNTTNLKRAVRGGSIKVVMGSLEPVAAPVEPIIPEPAPVLTENKSAEVITAPVEQAVEVPVVSEHEKVEEPVQEVQPVEEPAKAEEPAVVEQPVEEVEAPAEAVEEAQKDASEETVAKPKSNKKKK